MQSHTFSDTQRSDVQEYLEISSVEERLTWLMERTPMHAAIPAESCTPERRVPGCLSGLWLDGSISSETCHFSARSESAMVQGIVSFICDLYSGRTPEEVRTIGSSLADNLGLERLLSLTRKRAVASTLQFILATARSSELRLAAN
jgi:sulfur transfer protein SufE